MEKIEKKITRRKFTKLSALTLGSMPIMGFNSPIFETTNKTKDILSVSLFSKHLQFLDYNEMAAVTAEMGFDGLDLTVRQTGHVLPERVTNDLPRAMEAMKKYDLKSNLMTTEVWDVTKQEQKEVLETASKFGFKYYRTSWLKYPEERTIAKSQSIYGQQAKELEALNKKLGLIGCYQNHAGNHVGAPIWDLPPILSVTENKHIGCQYDIRHAVVEGGGSWELGLRHIKPFIKSIVIKDFKWGQVNNKWKPVNTPLGEGMVDFNRYLSLLKKYDIKVPVSLHLEYDLGGAEHGATQLTIDKKEVFAKMKKDLKYLRTTWANAQ